MRPFLPSKNLLPKAVAAWAIAAIAALCLLATYQYRSGVAELSEQVRATNLLLAERLAQHDAHLSALGAMVRMSSDEPSSNIQGLAENIVTRYPRIKEIATVWTRGQGVSIVSYGGAKEPTVELARDPDGLPTLGQVGEVVTRATASANAYDIFKLVAPGRMLRLRIDADELLGVDDFPPEYSVTLLLGDQVISSHQAVGRSLFSAEKYQVSNNAHQPVRLQVGRSFGVLELLPPRLVVPILLILAGTAWLFVLYLEASRERRKHERRAMLLEQNAKLAHAGRVNALGELASGIAHELAQPVAAMLSQSQAARRAMSMGRSDILEQALDANIREAKRAGDILSRMRAYISGAAAQMEKVSLADALGGALRIVESDVEQRGISLHVNFPEKPIWVEIDVIAFQQVIHNLIRNAADAVAHLPDPEIALAVEGEGNLVTITVSDNGPGIEPLSLQHIFEPFFTTKADGMGLGLPLSARLIEMMNGSIDARNNGGACFTIRLPSEGVA